MSAGQPAHRAKHTDGIRQVVDALQGDHHVVAAVGAEAVGSAGVDGVERDAIRHAARLGVGAGGVDGGAVDIEAVDLGVGVGHGDADRRPAEAAADVGEVTAPLQRSAHLRHRGQELLTEAVQEHRPVGGGLSLAGVVAVLLPTHSTAGSIRLHERFELLAEAGADGRERQAERQMIAIREHLAVARREAVPANAGDGGGIVDGEEARDRLVLQPLLRVAGVGGGAICQLGCRHRAGGGDGVVPSELVAQIGGVALQRPHRRGDDPLGQRSACGVRVDAALVDVGLGHASILQDAGTGKTVRGTVACRRRADL